MLQRLPLLVVVLALASCARTEYRGAETLLDPVPNDVLAVARLKARALIKSMSDRELIGQLMMTGVHGTREVSATSRSILMDLRPGAIMLFGYNITTESRLLASLTANIRSVAGVEGMPPFVAIDHEGGSVFRFKAGLTRLPSAASMGKAGEKAAFVAGETSGSELRALGVTMNMAPVVEASSDDNRAFISDRAWSGDPEAAGRLAAAFISACQAGGVAAVAKHYPGNAASDPHETLPVLNASQAELEKLYEIPFRRAIAGDVAAVMLSHALVPTLDATLPVTLSPGAIYRLKHRLGFKGIVMTDDLHMAALSGLGGTGPSALAALVAGADMLMISDEGVALDVHAFLLGALDDGSLKRSRLEDAVTRIMTQKLRFGLDTETDDERASMLEALEQSVTEHRASLLKAMNPTP